MNLLGFGEFIAKAFYDKVEKKPKEEVKISLDFEFEISISRIGLTYTMCGECEYGVYHIIIKSPQP